MQAQLVSFDGEITISLDEDVTVVGRKREVCDVLLDRSNISKVHCLIVKTDGLLLVRDLGSTNGTLVNGQRVTRGALLPGDELAFASVRFQVQFGADAAVEGESAHEERTEVMPLPVAEGLAVEIVEDPSSGDLPVLPLQGV